MLTCIKVVSMVTCISGGYGKLVSLLLMVTFVNLVIMVTCQYLVAMAICQSGDHGKLSKYGGHGNLSKVVAMVTRIIFWGPV